MNEPREKMKRGYNGFLLQVAGLGLSLTGLSLSAGDLNGPAIIPLPQKMELRTGIFKVTPEVSIHTDAASGETAKFLTERMRTATGYALKTDTKLGSGAEPTGGILLTTKNANPHLTAEGYELTVTSNSVVIRAAHQAGVFYGVQTLLQLLPPEIFSSNRVSNVQWQIPCVQIEDAPRFQWRGLMLDVSRHFYNTSEVKTVLDALALHKLNTFHWHLTDDQGWRIEIKKYPRLTSVGAWRSEVGFNLDTKSTTAYDRAGRYGGFYTQQEIREIVAYAAARHITIVPEIEMPGHATAALAAYPQFGSTSGPFVVPLKGGVFTGIFNPAEEKTFGFLTDVLTEVFQLFPGKYVHIGGDEVPKETWKTNAQCQALMKREGLKTEEELQSWFVRRMEKFISAHGRTMIGWSEILQGGLAQNAAVMDWIGGATEATRSGHDVVMSPAGYCYLDQYQSANPAAEPRAIGGFIPLAQSYSFEPVNTNLVEQQAAHILGAQGNLWTEYISHLSYAEYMMFPRLTALSEVDWSPKEARNFEDFSRRLLVQFRRYDWLGINYRRPTPDGPRAPPAR